ncbi:MAG TPA: hypothetical protein VKF41_06900 [Bryobacteraceae bacterium]|nr:hypothetical protein [Bryobacteraceae bacterium]
MLRFLAFIAILCLPAFGATGTATVDAAVQQMYNFDFPASHAILIQCIAAHPQDPLPYAFRAAAYLFYEMDRLGILESEFLVDDKRIIAKKKLAPDPAVRAQFFKALDDTSSRAEAVLAADPNDRNALFAMCISQGIATDYAALVEKRQLSSLSLAKRSNSYAQRLLRLDPKYYDAYLTTGFSEYIVGSLPFIIRWFVHFDNVSGSKERGVEDVRLVAREGHYFKPFAKILLGIADLREKKPLEARDLLMDLAHDYPDNPLFRKELAKVTASIGAAGN